jgi:hypothetical protein
MHHLVEIEVPVYRTLTGISLFSFDDSGRS